MWSSRLSSSATWMASSRVGASTRPWGFLGDDRVTRLTMGMPKAMVLPDPVGALPHRSLPARASGMVATWMGNGSSIPRSARVRAIASGTPREAKVVDMVAELLRATTARISVAGAGPRRWSRSTAISRSCRPHRRAHCGPWVRLAAPPLRSLSDRRRSPHRDRPDDYRAERPFPNSGGRAGLGVVGVVEEPAVERLVPAGALVGGERVGVLLGVDEAADVRTAWTYAGCTPARSMASVSVRETSAGPGLGSRPRSWRPTVGDAAAVRRTMVPTRMSDSR